MLLAYGRVPAQTSIGATDLSWQQRDQARSAAEQVLRAYQAGELTLQFEDGATGTRALTELGVSIDVTATLAGLDEHIVGATGNNWLESVGTSFSTKEVVPVVHIDQVMLDQTLAEMVADKSVLATDAVIKIDGATAAVVSEKNGHGYDADVVAASLRKHVVELSDQPLRLIAQTLLPKDKVADLQVEAARVKSLLQKTLALSVEDQNYSVTPEVFSEWLTFDADAGQVKARKDAVRKYLETIAGDVLVLGSPSWQVTETGVVEIEGEPGQMLDIDNSIDAIAQALTGLMPDTVNLTVAETAPRVENISGAAMPSQINGKEIVVVLGQQRIYAWNNGQLEKTYLISSGSTYPTYQGTFAVYNKIKDHTMAGDGYNLPHVPNSMYYDGLRALHGAYWHNNFGYPMSHGCVNEPLEEAAWLFDWTPVGTTVRVVG